MVRAETVGLWCLLLFVGGLAVAGLILGVTQPSVVAPTTQPSRHEVSESTHSVVTLPARSEYEREHDIRYKRRVKAMRICTPFGTPPGEVIAGVEKFEHTRPDAPKVDLDNGVHAGEASGGSMLGGAMKGNWFTAMVEWVIRWAKRLLILYALGLALGGVLWVIPGTRVIGSTLVRVLVSPIPILGAALEKIVASIQASAKQKQLTQVVAGVESYKAAHPTAKTELNAALAAKQDAATQAAVREAKGKP